MTNIELPKDAEGREIPLDTKVLYDQDGNPREVARFAYTLLRDCDKWDVIFVNGYDRYASEMLLEPPDSWEKLLEGLDRAASKTYCGACAYFGKAGVCACSSCIANKNESCERAVYANIASRIRNLRGEG